MIYNVSNNEYEIEKLLIELRNIYGDYAFISYIDGEYGIRIWVYNSFVYTFYNTLKKQGKICIGIVFKNTKCFINNLCDHIIEIDDIEFPSTIHYSGNDGFNTSYTLGVHSDLYEKILLDMNFSNIFYTLHVDGVKFINLHGCNNGYICKINNQNLIFNNININTCINSIHICEKYEKRPISNKIVIWIRNTNKWTDRNINPEYYKSLFQYCILNNKICCVFQDLIPIELPKHNNIIDCTTRVKNRPNFDYFIDLCNESDIFIGSDSGPNIFIITSTIKYF